MRSHKSVLTTSRGSKNVLGTIRNLKTNVLPRRVSDLTYLVAKNIKKVSQDIFNVYTAYDGDISPVEVYAITYDFTSRSKIVKSEVIATGRKVAFIEFGTGAFNDIYPMGLFDEWSLHGTYGQGKGNQQSWGFYGSRAGNPQSFVITNSLGKDIVISYGNQPARALYKAVQDTKYNFTYIAEKSDFHHTL